MLKSKTTIDEMIKLLENKNIKFILMSKEEARDDLIKNNNYYNITSYKKNFIKYHWQHIVNYSILSMRWKNIKSFLKGKRYDGGLFFYFKRYFYCTVN